MSVLTRPRKALRPSRYVKQRTHLRLVIGHGGFIGELSLTDILPDMERYRRNIPLLLFTEFYVHPLRRGRGWGSKLLAAMVRTADAARWDLITYARSYGVGRKLKDNDLSQLYQRYGFRPVARGLYLVRRCR